eukprot:NODE_48_length_31852_cov_1.054168.p7 type:complete len:605 gc:universal NODE_48_length_31852_cov_1.054168:16080-14266(-)
MSRENLNLSGQLDQYDFLQTLGTGAFSEVKKAMHKQTKQLFAIKIIDRAKCKGKESMIQSEIEILKKVEHPNIIKLYDMFETSDKIYLVMELVTGGELFDSIVERGKYTEKESAELIYQVVKGVEYLHSVGICHRDLKPENLLYYDKSKNSRIMLSDFGLSKIFNEDQLMKTACGTPGYVAPEVLRRKGYRKEVDMWSIGVIAYILLCGYPPFYEENNAELFNQILKGKFEFDSPYWDHISNQAKNFVSRSLVVDSSRRLTIHNALCHPFITEHVPEAMEAMKKDLEEVRRSTKSLRMMDLETINTQLKAKDELMDSAAVLTSRDQISMLSTLPFNSRASDTSNRKIANIVNYNFSSVSSDCLEMYRKALLEQIPSFEVVILQHMLSHKQKDNDVWTQTLKAKGFYVACSNAKSVWSSTDHGLAIVSKIPIISQNTMSLKKTMLLGDKFQSKAGLYARLQLNEERNIHVFSFDLRTLRQYSITKEKQFVAMKQFINACTKDMKKTDCIVTGCDYGIEQSEDFNEMNGSLRSDNTTRGGDLNRALILQDVLKLKSGTDSRILTNRILVGNTSYQPCDHRFSLDTTFLGSHNFCGVDGITIRVAHQ